MSDVGGTSGGFASRFFPPPGQVRLISAAGFVSSFGTGASAALLVVYFTRFIGLSPLEVGVAISVAAFAGLTAGIPLGHLGDRRGAREVAVLLLAMEGVSAAALVLVHTFAAFIVVGAVTAFLDRGAAAVRGGLIAGLLSSAERAESKAYLRALTNLAMALGGLMAAVALGLDTRVAFVVVLLLDALSFVLAAILLARVDHVPPTTPEEAAPMWQAARDLPFVAVTVVGSVLGMHYWILDIAMPVWVVKHTTAPYWMVAALMVLNTLVVALWQVRVARGIATVSSSVRACAVSGVLFVLCCVAFALSSGQGVVLAVVLLLVAGLTQVAGELFQASATFVLGYELAPDHAQGQYQGLYAMGYSVTAMAAPTLMALLPLALGTLGWLVLAAILMAAALLIGPTVRWAERTRPAYGVTRLAGPVV